MSSYNSSSHGHNSTRGLDFYQDELESKNSQIQVWQARFEEAKNQTSQIMRELTTAKAYIDTLPTKQEVVHLKNRLSSVDEEKAQLAHDYTKLKKKNLELANVAVKQKKDIKDLQMKLDSQISENEALKNIIKLWEARRKAAKESGHLTVEDVLVEKMKIQDQFDELLKVATCREEHFKAKIESMKMKVEDTQRAEKEAKRNSNLLLEKLEQLQSQLTDRGQEISDLVNEQKGRDAIIQELEEKIMCLETKEKLNLSTQNNIQYCLQNIGRCKKATEGIVTFIRSALDKKFIDPTLVFPSVDDSSIIEQNRMLDAEGIEKFSRRCVQKVDELVKGIELCQKSLTDRYVSELTNEVTSNCQIQ